MLPIILLIVLSQIRVSIDGEIEIICEKCDDEHPCCYCFPEEDAFKEMYFWFSPRKYFAENSIEDALKFYSGKSLDSLDSYYATFSRGVIVAGLMENVCYDFTVGGLECLIARQNKNRYIDIIKEISVKMTKKCKCKSN